MCVCLCVCVILLMNINYHDMVRFVDTVCESSVEVYGEVNGERHLLLLCTKEMMWCSVVLIFSPFND